ncbi:MAG: glutathione S-transferase [Anaerolineae bacterium]|nr:glutathione S-transferase [Gloeobacterales cyanobacterium ES-bin-313]
MSTIQPARPIQLYRHALSGHSHRVELFLSLLGLPFEFVTIDLLVGAQRSPEYLKLNPFGQVPTIDDDGAILSDSNAILVYLARKYDPQGTWLPNDALGTAQVERWLSVAASQINNGPATARLINVFGAKLDQERAFSISERLFTIMNAHLTDRAFLVGETPTIADVAGYTYIAHAPEGSISLEPYPHLRSWLSRIESLPDFVPMQKTAVGLFA